MKREPLMHRVARAIGREIGKHHTPLRPPRKSVLVVDWDYKPVPPFTIQWLSESGSTSEMLVEDWPTLEAAVLRFFSLGFPRRYGWFGDIIDANDRKVLGWSLINEHLVFGPWGWWRGVAEVFAVMDAYNIGDAVDRVFWETDAKSRCW